MKKLLPLSLLAVLFVGCTDAGSEKTAVSESKVSEGGCATVVNPSTGQPWPIQVCDDEHGRFRSTFERFGGVPAMGLPRTAPWLAPDGDWYQTFERVEMNGYLAHGGCEEGRACIAHLGRWDIARSGGSVGGQGVSCDDGSFAPRSDDCLPADFKDKYAREGGREFYGLMLSRVIGDCATYPNGARGECFYTERAKVSRLPGGSWQGELLGNKKMQADFDDDVGRLETDYAGCNECADLAMAPPTIGGVNAAVQPPVRALTTASIQRKDICKALEPTKAYGRPYVFVGSQVVVGTVAEQELGGELVWDLYEQQAAVFMYAGRGIGTSVAGASIYMGFAFDAGPGAGYPAKADVIDAWSGPFFSAGASLPLAQPLLSAGGGGFVSSDGQIVGMVGSLSLGLSWNIAGGGVDAQYNDYRAVDGLTDGYEKTLVPRLIGRRVEQKTNGKHVVQFNGTRDLAFALLQNLGPSFGAAPALTATAVGVLKSKGLTVNQLCP